jgi:hypothetical protein
MPSLDSPWFEQAGQAVAAVTTARSSSTTMKEAEMDDLLKRVGRPTLFPFVCLPSKNVQINDLFLSKFQ